MAERTLIDQAKTRLRRIEGQVRGIQGMLDRMEGESAESSVEEQVRELLAKDATPSDVARSLGITRRRVADISQGRCGPEGEPCDGLLTQLLAVRAAVEQVGVIIMELHLQHCVLGDLPEDEERLRNLREALKLWTRLSSA